ncbi:recombinase family protein [Ensifer sp. IC3342]|nr:recombinase family protein [Ensifer sp. BRP08]MCA1451460.1 recombinase family protein [Ensifer sp. IC3342]
MTVRADVEVRGVVFKARPGVRALFEHLGRERIDVVLCDELRHLSERTGVLGLALQELHGHGAELWSVHDSERITSRHLIGLILSDADNVHRKADPDIQEVHSEPVAGLGMAPPAFGYRYSHASDADGRRISGFRVIDPATAEIVRRIFRMYADGASARDIADHLNREGVLGPRGKAWRDTAIRGSRSRGAGTLNNPLYTGRIKSIYGADLAEVPGLRIIGDELWARVQERQGALAEQFAKPAAGRKKRTWQRGLWRDGKPARHCQDIYRDGNSRDDEERSFLRPLLHRPAK